MGHHEFCNDRCNHMTIISLQNIFLYLKIMQIDITKRRDYDYETIRVKADVWIHQDMNEYKEHDPQQTALRSFG